MSIPEANEALTAMLRSFMASVRKIVMSDGPAPDPVDRVLAAATLVAGAMALAWPQGKKLPQLFSGIATIGRHLWARRTLWVGSS